MCNKIALQTQEIIIDNMYRKQLSKYVVRSRNFIVWDDSSFHDINNHCFKVLHYFIFQETFEHLQYCIYLKWFSKSTIKTIYSNVIKNILYITKNHFSETCTHKQLLEFFHICGYYHNLFLLRQQTNFVNDYIYIYKFDFMKIKVLFNRLKTIHSMKFYTFAFLYFYSNVFATVTKLSTSLPELYL